MHQLLECSLQNFFLRMCRPEGISWRLPGRQIFIKLGPGHDRLGVGFIHACHKLLMKEAYDGDGDVVRDQLSGKVMKSFVLVSLSEVIEPRSEQGQRPRLVNFVKCSHEISPGLCSAWDFRGIFKFFRSLNNTRI